MKLEEQISFYDSRWENRSYLNSLKLRRAIQILAYFDVVKKQIKQPKTVDLGCGDGRFSSFIGEFTETFGLELSGEAVKQAQTYYPHVSYFQGDALNHPFETGVFDLVISQEVIEHIEDQEAYIKVCYELLKPGGYMIMTTPNKRTFDHMQGGNWSKQPIENLLSPKAFKALFDNGFRILSYDSVIFNFGHLGYFSLINHRIIIGICNRLGLKGLREYFLSKKGFGLHQCVLVQKRIQ